MVKTSPSRLRRATSPIEGRLWHTAKLSLFARGSPTRGNGDDRRQRRKQGGAVGAAASRMQATAKQTLGAATRSWRAKQTERLDEGQPAREPLRGKPLRHCLRDATSPIEGRPWHTGKTLLFASGSPFGGAGERSETERARPLQKNKNTAIASL